MLAKIAVYYILCIIYLLLEVLFGQTFISEHEYEHEMA